MLIGGASPFSVTAIGAGVGLLGGMFGKGGSAIATPLLHLVGVPALVAVASPLPATIPSTAAAAAAYGREGMIDRRVLAWTIIFGVPATVAGALATRWIGGGPLIVATDILIASLGFRFLIWPTTDRPRASHGPSRLLLALVAIAVGLISGLLANSGGFLLAPLFAAVLGMELKAALGTSLAAACVLAVPGTIVHVALGHVDWGVVIGFGIASIPLSALGARIALRTGERNLERSYGAMLATLGVALLAVGG